MAQINIEEGTNVSVTINRGPLNNGTVGGTNTQVQFNKNGVFGGISSVTSDGLDLTIQNISNLKINGGAIGQVISTDGAGNLSFINYAVGNGVPSGPDFSVQIANAGNFYGEGDFRYIPGTKVMYVPSVVTSNVETTTIVTDSISVANVAVLPNLPNIRIGGGINNQVISTDGTGNLNWITLPTIEDTPPAGSNTQIQFNDNGVFGADPEFYYNKSSNTLNAIHISATNFYGNAENLYDINGANVFGVVPLANMAYWSGNATNAQSAATAGFANAAGTVTDPYQPNIARVGTLEQLTVEGIINLNDLSNIHITGGNAGDVLKTDGTGNLYWAIDSGNGGGNVTVNIQPSIEFTALADGVGQWFVDPLIGNFQSESYASVYVNGILLQTIEYYILGVTLFINRYLSVGDVVIVGAIGGSNGGVGPIGYPPLSGDANTYLNGAGQWITNINTTKEIQVEFDATFAGDIYIGDIPAGSTISGVTIIITDAFNPAAQILVHDGGVFGTLMDTTDLLPEVVGQYNTEPTVKYTSPTPVYLNIYPGTEIGLGLVFISYQ